MKKGLRIMAAAFFLVLMLGGSSFASFVGYIYEGDSTAAFNPSLGPTAGSGIVPIAFTVDQLNFDTRIAGGTTYGGFLGGAGNVNNVQGLSAAMLTKTIVTASDPLAPGAATSSAAGPTIYGTFFAFTGTANFAANTAINHDDGFWLDLGGTIYNFSTPTSPAVTYLGNSAGVYNFTLYYGAWNSFPEVLQVRGATSVPEPTTMLLLGLGMLGVAAFRRK